MLIWNHRLQNCLVDVHKEQSLLYIDSLENSLENNLENLASALNLAKLTAKFNIQGSAEWLIAMELK